jgi:hypothetical protein
MIKVLDNELWRGSDKIGWLEMNAVFDENGRKLGYFYDKAIFNANGDKIAYILDNRLETMDGRKIYVDDLMEHVSGYAVPDIARAAVYLLIGD